MGKMESGFLKDMPKKGPFEVPEDYFLQLREEIMDKVSAEKQLPALPPAASARAVFQVPPAYFDSLPARIAARTAATGLPAHASAKGAVEPVHIPVAGRRWDRYYQTAVAACVALLLSIFSVLQVEKKNDPADSFVNIANFDEETLVQEYLESAPPSGDDQNGELESYFLNQVDESLLLQEL